MRKGSLNVLIDIIILLSILIVSDIIVGIAGNKYAQWLNKAPRKSDAALVNYNLNAAAPDVAIIGSSTAICHYDPDIIHDSLLALTGQDLEVFNMGMSRQKMAYNYYALKSLLERKTPIIVIEDVWASNVSQNDYPKLFEEMRPYVKTNHNIRELLNSHDSYSCLMKSNLYCYNTALVKMLMAATKPKGANGFHSSNVEMNEISKDMTKDMANTHPVSTAEFDAMINICKKKGVNLFVILSPTLHASDTTSASYKYMEAKCRENNIPFLDYSNDNRYYNPRYFSDVLHMNKYGAEFFTKELMKDIKDYIK